MESETTENFVFQRKK